MPDFTMDEIIHEFEAKDNNKKVRMDYENLFKANKILFTILGDKRDTLLNAMKNSFKILVGHFNSWMDDKYDNEQLTQIEISFINITRLQSELHTCDISNKDLKALAYFGLHAIDLIRGDHTVSIVNLLKVFIFNPRMARYNLCYDFYINYLYPCISENFKMDLKNLSSDKKYDGRKLTINKMRNDSDLRRYRLEEIERKIDEECIYIAEIAIRNFVKLGDII